MSDGAGEDEANAPHEAATDTAPVARRRWRRALAPLAASAAAIAVAVTAVLVTHAFEARQTADVSPSASATVPISSSASATMSTSPSASAVLGISTTAGTASGYRLASTVTMVPEYLDCITKSVCYAWFTRPASGSGAVIPGLPAPGPSVRSGGLAMESERTSDAGATWQKLASPPGNAVLNNEVQPSCPTVNECVAVADRDALAVTTDGGARWRLDPLPVADSAGWIDALSCTTVQECVVHVSGSRFLSTTDGGQAWTVTTHLPASAPGALQLLRCDPSGQCIGAVSAGLGTAYTPGNGPALKIMRSVDRGLTWTYSVINSVPPESSASPGLHMACSDAMHCVYAGGSGVVFTSDGGRSWRLPATPPAWPGFTITSVSCGQGLECSVALAPSLASQAPVIETTSDGMTWTAQALPSSPDDPLQYVTMLSCPVPAGCIGLASTLSQERSAFLGSGGFSSGIVQTSPQMLISSLGG